MSSATKNALWNYWEKGYDNETLIYDEESSDDESNNSDHRPFLDPYQNDDNKGDKNNQMMHNNDSSTPGNFVPNDAPHSDNNIQQNEGICRVDKFEVIKHSVGNNEEFLSVRILECNSQAHTIDGTSRIYLDIFHKKDEDFEEINLYARIHNHLAAYPDFRASRLVPLDHKQLTTLIQGTLRYLDLQYYHTNQLTKKSNVYSFGVTLAEPLIGKIPIGADRINEEMNLATYFVNLVKNHLFEIIEPRLIRERTLDKLHTLADLVKRCVSLQSHDRPTMKEVVMELDDLRNLIAHP
ncbi:kinase RLK-Pelle-WAK family protein [Tanacetum coccineum]